MSMERDSTIKTERVGDGEYEAATPNGYTWLAVRWDAGGTDFADYPIGADSKHHRLEHWRLFSLEPGSRELTSDDGRDWAWEVTYATKRECLEWVAEIGAKRQAVAAAAKAKAKANLEVSS